MRLATPQVIVDLARLPSLDGVEEADGALRIGALARQRALERSPLVGEGCPLLAEALPFVGHAAIRNRGTIGGSLAHADPAAELPAVAVALGAVLETRRPAGGRRLAAADFFVLPLVTVLEPDELVVAIDVPVRAPGTGYAWLELSRRHGDFALAGVAAVVEVDGDGRAVRARLALAGVAPAPVAVDVPGEALADAGRLAAAAARPPSDVHASAAYRRRLVGVLAERATERALARARAA